MCRLATGSLVLVQLLYCGWHVVAKRALNSGLNPFVLALYRQWGAVVCLVGLAYLVDGHELGTAIAATTSLGPCPAESPRKRSIPMRRRDAFSIILLGFLGFGNIYGFIIALSMVTSFNSALLHPTIPVVSAVVAAGTGVEKLGKGTAMGVLFGALGALVVVGLGVPEDPNTEGAKSENLILGNLVLAGQCVCMGCILVLQKAIHANTTIPPTTLTFLYNVIVAVLAVVVTPLLVPPSSVYVPASQAAIAALVYGSLIGICIIYSLLAWATTQAGPTLVALSMTLQPPFNAVLAVLFLDRTSFTSGEIIGGLLILLGLVVTLVFPRNGLPVDDDHVLATTTNPVVQAEPPTAAAAAADLLEEQKDVEEGGRRVRQTTFRGGPFRRFYRPEASLSPLFKPTSLMRKSDSPRRQSPGTPDSVASSVASSVKSVFSTPRGPHYELTTTLDLDDDCPPPPPTDDSGYARLDDDRGDQPTH